MRKCNGSKTGLRHISKQESINLRARYGKGLLEGEAGGRKACGDDADTTGAVCGQLAGAYWGESGIPKEWREGLAHKDMVEKALNGLLD